MTDNFTVLHSCISAFLHPPRFPLHSYIPEIPQNSKLMTDNFTGPPFLHFYVPALHPCIPHFIPAFPHSPCIPDETMTLHLSSKTVRGIRRWMTQVPVID
jgi:hypothetical protein